MDRGAALLQGLLTNLRQWAPHIRRVTCASEVEVEYGDRGAFSLVVSWPGGSHRRDYTREFVFGASYSLSPDAWAVQRRACDYARDLMREVLQQRGAL